MKHLSHLPLSQNIETKAVMRQAVASHRYLAELKGAVRGIPNENILIDTLGLQEAKDSSEIEQIVTTHDDLFQASFLDLPTSAAAKEVKQYARALREGFTQVTSSELLLTADILQINGLTTGNDSGYRRLPGTELQNEQTGETVYIPPQDARQIEDLMSNLISYINDTALCPLDPLVKMAIIHHQFESIHPFYDGNGRTGRIINILYLVQQGLLDIPVLYLSRFIVRNKPEYYALLQSTRKTANWEPWILYMLKGIETTAKSTLQTVLSIGDLMLKTKHRLRDDLPKIYSQDLLNTLFQSPYTRNEFLVRDLNVSRPTARRYLNHLVERGFVTERQIGRSKFYFNESLIHLLKKAGDMLT